MRIEFTRPINRVIQKEIKEEFTHFIILKFEDDGETISAITDFGYILIYGVDNYPRNGIFGLDRNVIVDLVKTEIESIYIK